MKFCKKIFNVEYVPKIILEDISNFFLRACDNVTFKRTIRASDGYEQCYAYIYDIYQTNIYTRYLYIYLIYIYSFSIYTKYIYILS